MLKPITKLFVLFVCFFASNFAISQVTGYWIQVVETHDGMVDDYDLTGYCTYDLYVTVDDPAINITTISSPVPDCDDPIVDPMFFDFPDCGLFQHPDAGPDSWSTFCPNLEDPDLESLNYDSYFTIGSYCFGEGGTVVNDIDCPADAIDVFEGTAGLGAFDGGDFSIDVGFYGTFGTDVNTLAEELPGQPGVYGVRIMRYTTCCGGSAGNAEGCSGSDQPISFNFEVSGTGFAGFQVDSSMGDPSPCADLVVDYEVIEPVACFGDQATVEISTGDDAYGPYNYQLFDSATDMLISEGDSAEISGLEAGNEYYVIVENVAGCECTSEIIEIPNVEFFVATATLTQDIVCPGETGTICYEVEGGTPDFSATLLDDFGMIYDPVAGVDPYDGCFENLPCGNFTLQVEDGNGCTSEDFAAVTCVTLMEETTTVNDIACFGDEDGSIDCTLTGGTGEITFEWFNEDGDVLVTTIVGNTADAPLDCSVTGLASGDYYFVATDANSCQISEDDFTISQPDELILDLIPTDVTCFGACDGMIEANGSGGTGDLTYACGDGLEELCEGDYTCIVTDENNCTAEDTTTINQPDPVVFEFDFELISCADACDGSVTLTNFIGGTGDVDVTITPAIGTIVNNYPAEISISDLCADVYTVEISDNGGACVFTEEVIIPNPDPLLGNIVTTPVTCSGLEDATIDITCTGEQGDVTIIGLGDDSQLCPSLFENLAADVYDITLQDTMGCIYQETVEIIDPESLVLNIVNENPATCGGYSDGSIEAETVGGTGTIEWFINDDPNPIIVPADLMGLGAGVYDITVIDENGCEDTQTGEVTEPDEIQVIPFVSSNTCTGMNDGSAILTLEGGNAPLGIEFSDPEPDFDFDANVLTIDEITDGSYPYVVEDVTGCVFVDTLVVEPVFINDIEFEIFTTPVTCWNEDDGTATVAVTGGVEPITYEWSDANLQTENIAVGLTNDTYLVTITDGQGCELTQDVTIEMNEGCFFIAEAISPNGDGYNDDWVVGGLEFFPESTVQVFNRWGQLLFESKGYPTRWDGTFDGKNLPMADYYYVIVYDPAVDPILGTVTIKY